MRQVSGTLYYMTAGDKIARHGHASAHSTEVVVGITEVELWGDNPRTFKMAAGESFILPTNVDHEVRALEDRTIVFHGNVPDDTPTVQAGVTLVDS